MTDLTLAHSKTDIEQTLDDMATAILAQKNVIKQEQAKLTEMEQRLIAHVGANEEGAFAVECDHFKITTTGKINRTVNASAVFDVVQPEIAPDIFSALFDFQPKLNTRFFKQLQESNPAIYAVAAKAVTAKPGKTAVTITPLNK